MSGTNVVNTNGPMVLNGIFKYYYIRLPLRHQYTLYLYILIVCTTEKIFSIHYIFKYH